MKNICSACVLLVAKGEIKVVIASFEAGNNGSKAT